MGRISAAGAAGLILWASCSFAAPYGLDATAGNAFSGSSLLSGDSCGIFADGYMAQVIAPGELTVYGGSGYGARGRSASVKTAVSVQAGGKLEIRGGTYGAGFSKKARGRFLAAGDIAVTGLEDNGIHGIDAAFIQMKSSGDFSAASYARRAVYLTSSASADLSSDGSQTFRVNVGEIRDNNEVIKVNNQAFAKITAGGSQWVSGGSHGVSLSYDAEILMKAGQNQTIAGTVAGVGLDGAARAEISSGGDQILTGGQSAGLYVGGSASAAASAARNQSFVGGKYGASFTGSASADLQSGGTQSFSGERAGLYLSGLSEASFSAVQLHASGSSSGVASCGIQADGGSISIAVSDSAVIQSVSDGSAASAVFVSGAHFALNASGDVKICADGADACGIRLDAAAGTTAADIAARTVSITAAGSASRGIAVSGSAPGTAAVTARDDILIQAAEGVSAVNAAVRLTADRAVISSETAALTADGGSVSLHAFSNCLTAPGGTAAAARNGGTVRIADDEENYISGRTAVSASGAGSLAEITGRLSVITGTELALHASDGGRIAAGGGAGRIEGRILAESGGAIDVDFAGADSFFRGSAAADSTSSVRLSFSDGARWAAEGDSSVTKLELRRGALVDLRGARSLTAGQLSGGDSSFLMKIRSGTAPLRVTGESSGVYSILVDESLSDLSPAARGEKMYFASAPAGGAAFRAEPVTVTAPSLIYDAVCRVSADTGPEARWYFAAMPAAGRTVNANVGAAERISQFQRFSASETDTYDERTGRARYLGRGVWLRGKYSRAEFDGRVRASGTMAQIGFNAAASAAGLALDYRKDSLDFRGISGSGSSRRLGVTAYSTLFGRRGQYADFTARAGVLRTDYDVTLRNAGMISRGRSSRGYMSVSAEYGRRFDLGSGWRLTPQLQLQWTVLGAESFAASSGIAVHQESAQSLTGRAGIRAEFAGGRPERRFSLFLKADVLRQFLDDGGFSAVGTDARYEGAPDSARTWYELGAGLTAQTGRDAVLFADFSRLSGSGLSDAWRISAGLRCAF